MTSDNGFDHITVLKGETIDSLDLKEGYTVVDATAGGGGHSAAALEKIGPSGKLVCIDRDPYAVAHLKKKFEARDNVQVVQGNFVDIRTVLDGLDIASADGIIADLGVSSVQIDDPERGFSFKNDGQLSMQMTPGSGLSARDVVNTFPEGEIRHILSYYGEEKLAGRIAAEIVRQRQKAPIETTMQLCKIIEGCYPAALRRNGHYAKKVFLALRIYINNEIDNLNPALNNMFSCLSPGGRLAVIAFHSLEQRAVKEVFKDLTTGCTCSKDFPVCVCGRVQRAKIVKRALPSEEETEANPRSRSARLTTIEKLTVG